MNDNRIEIAKPTMLIVTGGPERVEVSRSLVVRNDDSIYLPALRFIAARGLVLAARETFADRAWMMGQVEVSVYVTPAARNAALARI